MNIRVPLLIVDDQPKNLTALESVLDSPEYHSSWCKVPRKH